MDTSDQADRISNLPDVLLVLIISCLSFRWRSVYLETRNVSFKETDFLSPSRSRFEKEVKNLVLDFSNPAWRTFQDVNLDELVVEIPQSVYDLATLDSLKVGACKKFDSEKLSNLGKLKTVSFR
ncbi:PREDICTED: putative F-box/LRR-repeat protein At1g56400 [Brassica oleracea var. oleracea]|uniref:putative F-box/LRR-repeat protein At1g56400 n=1 Tax=Brassica oleracea var. oleracea TaxID=109376 RepID=UPI0006A71FFA|nr:PREDICTED: putative F-box/LRR-repeat protein At1g56400 [Brassica oleracea var. oleracea]